ncbi:MAG TPA: hypothetical protein VKH19_09555 [Gemmatimonadaceae bacterium]|nr:hypothetical protein [Gemmatimonadaceae bacterium]
MRAPLAVLAALFAVASCDITYPAPELWHSSITAVKGDYRCDVTNFDFDYTLFGEDFLGGQSTGSTARLTCVSGGLVVIDSTFANAFIIGRRWRDSIAFHSGFPEAEHRARVTDDNMSGQSELRIVDGDTVTLNGTFTATRIRR